MIASTGVNLKVYMSRTRPKACLATDSMTQREANPKFPEKCYGLVVMESLYAYRNQESSSTVSISWFELDGAYQN